MMELSRHIEILLLNNDCVIVPNLGGFMAHHVHASYDKADGMFIPPRRTLGFNPQLNMSDSLLAQSYADTYDISIPEAIARVNHEVSILKQRIETNGKYEFNDLGTIYLRNDGRYEFEPCSAGILTPDLYGFGAIDVRLLSSALKAATTISKTEPMSIIHPASVKPSSKLATIMSQIEHQDQQEEKTVSIKVSLLRNLAVTAVAAVALVLFARPVPVSESGNVIEQNTEQASMLSLPSSPSEAEQPSTDVVNILGSLDIVSQKILESSEERIMPATGDYTIVLACSLPLENAKAFLADVQAKGAKKAVLFTQNDQNMITYGSYKESNEAYEQLQKLQADGCVASGWILHVK